MKAEIKLYEAYKLLEKPLTEVKDKVVENIDEFMQNNDIVEIASTQI